MDGIADSVDVRLSELREMVKLLPVMPGFDPWVWKIPWRRKWQKSGVLQSMGSQRVGHNLVTEEQQ